MDKIRLVKNQVMFDEWRHMVEECRNSGQTVVDWCRDNCVNIKTYYYRLRRLRDFVCDNISPEIVPVNTLPQQLNNEYGDSNQIKIKSGGINIELPHDISPELLCSVIGALKC